MNAYHPPAPVLCLAFNRPELIARIFDALRKAGPRELFVAIDGPRADRPGEATLCREVQRLSHAVDWASRVHLKVETSNLGCGPAVSSAISWALSQTPELIIIEDDCLPDPSFLYFCDELLNRYRDDPRVMQIAGTNWGAAAERYDGHSYAFTSFAPIWGWATWRRAWELYDYNLDSWPLLKSSGQSQQMRVSERFRKLLEKDWELVRTGRGTWDHQWQYTVLRHQGLSVSPAKNLVRNLGFRPGGTHHQGTDSVFSQLPLDSLSFPLRHPPEVVGNASVESVFDSIYQRKMGWAGRLYRTLLPSSRLREWARPLLRLFVPPPS